MSKKLKSTLQYLFALLLAASLLWLAFHNLTTVGGESKLDFLWRVWSRSNKWYLWAMVLISILSNVLRAYRWKMLLGSVHHQVNLMYSFLALMVGYLVNLALPRGGEIARCYNLFKLKKIPVEISFGTVIAERGVDVIFLFLLSCLFLFLEWNNLESTMIPSGWASAKGSLMLYIPMGFVLLVGFMIYLFRKNARVTKLLTGFKTGLLSILQLKKFFLFIVISAVMWGLYFLMTYCVMKAFPETTHLGFRAIIAVFAVGTIAISIPLPGGVGSYHTLVPPVLVVLYGIDQMDAIAVVFILHAWQTVVTIVPGVVSLLISYQIIRWKKHITN